MNQHLRLQAIPFIDVASQRSRLGKAIDEAMARVLGHCQFINGPEVMQLEELPVPLGLVTADLLSGREVVLRRGPVWQAVLATCSIPGIHPAQPVGPYLLVDGGNVEPVPVAAAVSLGADVVIAVRRCPGCGN